jgi:predicted nucleotidyltransferase
VSFFSCVPTAIYRDGVATPSLTDLRNRRGEIIELARARGASNVRVFGSVARGNATEASDIDFLVDLDEGRNLLDLGGLLMDLRDLLGHDVDVAVEARLRPRVVGRVLADAVDL